MLLRNMAKDIDTSKFGVIVNVHNDSSRRRCLILSNSFLLKQILFVNCVLCNSSLLLI